MSVPARAESGQSLRLVQGRRQSHASSSRSAAAPQLIDGQVRRGSGSRALNYFRRAGAYLRQQDYDKAISDFGDGLALDAGNAAAYYGRAIAYEARRTSDRASRDYDAAIELDPRNVKALSNRAAIYADQRAYERALEDNNRVIELEPDQAAGVRRPRAHLCAPRRLRICAPRFPTGPSRSMPNRPSPCFNRGRVYFSKGEVERAIQDYGAAIDIGPKHASAFESRGFAYLSQGQIDKAIADYDAALQLDAKRATALYGRGTAKLKKGDASGADDIAAARAIRPGIAGMFEQSGVQR